MTARALCLAMLFVVAAPAARAQSSDAPPSPPPGATPPPPPAGAPPPPAYRPPPPPGYGVPPPPYRPRRAGPYVLPEAAPANTARLSVGMTFANDGYDCWYGTGAVGYSYYSCGYGYGYAWPNVNAEVDIGINPMLALSVGGNVFWGSDNTYGLNATVWEPHVDLLIRSSPYSDVRGRLRIGVGLYAAHASMVGGPGNDETGGAFRLGAGVSFFSRSRFGIGIDGIFESGSIGGTYVSDFQLLIGPELHF